MTTMLNTMTFTIIIIIICVSNVWLSDLSWKLCVISCVSFYVCSALQRAVGAGPAGTGGHGGRGRGPEPRVAPLV